VENLLIWIIFLLRVGGYGSEKTRSIRTKILANEYSTQKLHITRLDLHTAIKVLFKTEHDKDKFLCPQCGLSKLMLS
jgi:hypothetical protein